MPAAVDSEGPDCCELSTAYGLEPFAWQRAALIDTMGVRADGRWAASRVGWSVPRQNGKNGGVESFEVHATSQLGMRVLHSAHEVKTARKAFKRLLDFFDNPRLYPELAALVKEIRRTNGQEAVELWNGGGVEFVARTKSSGRGFSADVLLCDEAQELTDDELEAMLPTISASSNPLVFLIGTPPKPDKPAAVWRRFRQTAVDGSDPRQCWIEYGVEPDADFSDRENQGRANPGAPESIGWETIDGERSAMSAEGFGAERMGVWWPRESLHESRFPAALWPGLIDSDSAISGVPGLSVDVTPDGGRASIGAAGRRPGDGEHVELLKNEPGTSWLVADTLTIARAQGIGKVGVDTASPAWAFKDALEAGGLEVVGFSLRDSAAACGQMAAAIRDGAVHHRGQPGLDAAVGSVATRDVGDGLWVFTRRSSTVDISPLVAVTLARSLAATAPAPVDLLRSFW